MAEAEASGSVVFAQSVLTPQFDREQGDGMSAG